MPGYWIVKGGEIRDQAAYGEYAKRWGPVAERFGARILNAGGRLDAREGAWGRAVACYEDEEYQAGAALRAQGIRTRSRGPRRRVGREQP